MDPNAHDRRDFLKRSGALLGAAALAGRLGAQDAKAAPAHRATGAATPAPSKYKTKRVIVVAFAGGVRTKDTLAMPANVPSLTEIAKQGVVYSNARAANLGHFAAALSIFTGVQDYAGIRENERGDNPTLFEYLRKQLNFGAGDVWLSATGGVQQTNFTYSYHRNYGEKYGANLISGDGIFNAEFQKVLASFGKVRAPDESEADALTRLRGVMADEFKARGGTVDELNSPQNLRSIEKFIQDELKNDVARITGPGAGDAKTVRIASSLFRGFKPKVLGIVLQQADVAHGSYNAYVEVIRRNDAEIGRLWNYVQADPVLKDTTSIFVLPEFGRNKDLNERNGLDHGDNSAELHNVALVAAGPDFKPGQVVKRDIMTIDVCPTVCELLGAKPELAKGKVLRDAFA